MACDIVRINANAKGIARVPIATVQPILSVVGLLVALIAVYDDVLITGPLSVELSCLNAKGQIALILFVREKKPDYSYKYCTKNYDRRYEKCNNLDH